MKLDLAQIPVDTVSQQTMFIEGNYLLLIPPSAFTQAIASRLETWKIGQLHVADHMDESNDENSHHPLEHSREYREKALQAYRLCFEAAEALNDVFATYKEKLVISQNSLMPIAHKILDIVKQYGTYALNLDALNFDLDTPHGDLVRNSFMGTLLTTAISIAMGIPSHHLIELCVSALVHKIGMVHLPKTIYASLSQLDNEQRRILRSHPLIAYKSLQKNNFNPRICAAVIEAHEFLDGSGYPRGISGSEISRYGRILSMVQRYIGYIAKRPYRRMGNRSHYAIAHLLKHRGIVYDEKVVTILVELLSLYPIGNTVELANGFIGITVQPQKDDPKSPLVKLVLDNNNNRIGNRGTVDTGEEEYRIVRVIDSMDDNE